MNPRVLAQIKNPVLPSAIGSGTMDQGVSAFGKFISAIIGFLFLFAFLLAFGTLLIGAINWVTSGGDKARLEMARNKITHAILGLIIVGAAWSIMVLVGNWFGLDVTKLPFPTLESVK